MKYRAMATDYDGTLAADELVDEPTLDALKRYRYQGDPGRGGNRSNPQFRS